MSTDSAEKARQEKAEFLLSLGDAHRDLWVRRIKKGMKPVLQARFDALVAEHTAYLASLPKELPNRPGLEGYTDETYAQQLATETQG